MEGVATVVLVGDRVVDLAGHGISVRVVLDPVGVPTDNLKTSSLVISSAALTTRCEGMAGTNGSEVWVTCIQAKVGEVVVPEDNVLLDTVLVQD